MFLKAMLLMVLPFAASFTMEMTYKPPVQSSVSKLRNSRFPKQDTPPTSRSNSSKKATAALNHPDLISAPSFEERMLGLVQQPEKPAAPKRNLPPNVFTVETLEEYKEVVGDETNKLVAVRFFAPWCRACKAVAPLFYHMANTFPNVKFVDVPVTDRNTNLHQGLGVPSLPFGHVYHPKGGLVEELRITRPFISQFATKLQTYVTGSCELKAIGDCSSPYKSNDEK
jgi:thiol-disulfide isomerase/thioredoxin